MKQPRRSVFSCKREVQSFMFPTVSHHLLSNLASFPIWRIELAVVCALAGVGVFAGCGSLPAGQSRIFSFEPGERSLNRSTGSFRMKVNESMFLAVRARDLVTDSHLEVEKGELYDFRVPPGISWVDLIVRCGADGYDNAYMRLFAATKRVREARWFELCGRIGDDDRDSFAIGQELPGFVMPRSGQLGFFANDNRQFYWNNFGAIPLLIHRVR